MAWSNLAFFYLTTSLPKLSPHNIQRFIFYSFRLISLTLLVADLLCTLDTPVGKTSTQVAAILGFEHILWWIGDAFIDAFDWKKASIIFLVFTKSHVIWTFCSLITSSYDFFCWVFVERIIDDKIFLLVNCFWNLFLFTLSFFSPWNETWCSRKNP